MKDSEEQRDYKSVTPLQKKEWNPDSFRRMEHNWSESEPAPRREEPKKAAPPAKEAEPDLETRMVQSPLTGWLFHKETGKFNYVLVLGIMFVCLGIQAVFWLMILTTKEGSEQEEIPLTPMAQTSEPEKYAVDLLQRFYRCKSVEEQLALIRYPEKVRPLIDFFYSREPFPPPAEVYVGMTTEKTDGIWSLMSNEVRVPGKPRPFLVWVERSSGEMKIDWETAVGFQPFRWSELADVPSDVWFHVRALCKAGDYYNYGYSDQGKWCCFEMLDPYSLDILFAYVDREAPYFKAFHQAALAGAPRRLRAIVPVQYFKSRSSENQVEIVGPPLNDWAGDYRGTNRPFNVDKIAELKAASAGK